MAGHYTAGVHVFMRERACPRRCVSNVNPSRQIQCFDLTYFNYTYNYNLSLFYIIYRNKVAIYHTHRWGYFKTFLLYIMLW